NAQLDFDLPRGQRAELEKLLTKVGSVVSSSSKQAPPGETATDKTVGFRLMLKPVASIPPRETFTLKLASRDVAAAFRSLQAMLALADGQVRKAALNEPDKVNTSADFDFDVPSAKKKDVDKLLAEVGSVLSSSTAQAAAGETATDKKVGYKLTLKNAASIEPREKIVPALEAADVDQTIMAFMQQVTESKGTVTSGPHKSQEPSGKKVVIAAFDVPMSAKDDLVRRLSSAGRVRVQKSDPNPQVPD